MISPHVISNLNVSVGWGGGVLTGGMDRRIRYLLYIPRLIPPPPLPITNLQATTHTFCAVAINRLNNTCTITCMLVKISTSPYDVHTCMNIVMLYAKELKKHYLLDEFNSNQKFRKKIFFL